MSVVGIVPAAGSGERLGSDGPKAFVVCAGRPLVEWSLDVLEAACDRVVLAVLRDDVSQMPKNWNRRFKHNREKIKTGDVFELAEVVRNLAIRETEKGLSTGEKQMYTRAKKILASELMYALEKSEDEAEAYLDELLTTSAAEKCAAAAAK